MVELDDKHFNLTAERMRHSWGTRGCWNRFIYLKSDQPSCFHTFEEFRTTNQERTVLLVIRIITIKLLVMLLGLHVRSLRIFLWEQAMTAGVLVTYTLAIVALALCTGSGRCESKFLQAYLLCTGAAFLTANCAGIWRRWRRTSRLGRNMVELLVALGIPIRRYILLKALFSAAAALCMITDLALVTFYSHLRSGTDSDSDSD